MEESATNRPTVSVVIPAYNVASYICDAVESIKRQSFDDFEVIVVDDGSSDDTADVYRQATKGDGRFRLVEQRNVGPATARNKGISLARGVYLMFVDADDLLAENALARLVGFARQNDLDYLDFNAHTVYESLRLRAVRDESFYEERTSIPGVMTGPELFCAFQAHSEYVCALWLHFFKRSLLDGPDLRLRDGMYVHEDELFSPLLIARAERAAFLNEPLYQRRVRAGSAMTSGRGMRNVSSLFEAAHSLQVWLRTHADEFESTFTGAFAQRIAELYQLACEDATHVSPDDLIAYSESLDAADRVDFEVSVVQGAVLRDEFYGSTTWRVGEAALALPNALRKFVHTRRG